jgi:transposase
MAKSLSLDLRERVVAAVAGGVSRRQAAERFGVSAASAVRWCALERKTGDARPKPQGGDRHSHRIEAHAAFILDAVAKRPDITLAELRALLAGRGVSVAVSTLWRFFDRRRITFKKRPRTRANRIVPTL